ncbi:kinase-like protein [Heliocybe sulcata]|uniref:Kinase-like protein n=1 Tax=Heliocybe sulcata TaxID=5364 RepID=A0A5C3N986_9AGAM|nr:kinase-like protein [Heliocybe sulcata]
MAKSEGTAEGNRSFVKKGPVREMTMEAAAMRFVAENTSIPCPKVFDCCDLGDGTGSITMEYAEGELLAKVWRHLTQDQKISVARQISKFLDELRSIQHPFSGRICSADDGPFYDEMLCWADGRLFGPFATEAELNDWRMRLYSPFVQRHPPTAETLAAIRCRMRDDHPIVFTHGDIHRKNIFVRRDGEHATVSALIDWGQSGWRPLHWETMKFLFLAPSVNDAKYDWGRVGWEHICPGFKVEASIEGELMSISGVVPSCPKDEE